MSALLRPEQPARRRQLASYRTLRPELIEVTVGGVVIGYIERVGEVFVALRGERYDLAIEVAQSMLIEVVHGALCSES